jgi:nitric oxide reductase subunit B
MALMLITNLFPGGVLQLRDVLENGYWPRAALCLRPAIGCARLSGCACRVTLVFLLLGVVPLVIAAAK